MIFFGAVFPLCITEARNVPNLKHINQNSIHQVHKAIAISNGSLIDRDAPNLESPFPSEIKGNGTWEAGGKVNFVTSMRGGHELEYSHETTSEHSKPLIVGRPIKFLEEKSNSSEETVFPKENISKRTSVNVLCKLLNSSLLLDRKLCVNTTLQKKLENNSTSPSMLDVGEKKEFKWKYAKANGVVRLRNLTRLSNKAPDGSTLTNRKTQDKIPYPSRHETNVVENEQLRDVINNSTNPLQTKIPTKSNGNSLSLALTTKDGSNETTTDYLWSPFQYTASSRPTVFPPHLRASHPISGILNSSVSQLHPSQLSSKDISAPGLNINMSKPDLPELIPTTEQNSIKQHNGGKGKTIKSGNITEGRVFSDINKEGVGLGTLIPFLPSTSKDSIVELPSKEPEGRSTIEAHTTDFQYDKMMEILQNHEQNSLVINLTQAIELNFTKKDMSSEPSKTSARNMNYKSFVPEFPRRNGEQRLQFLLTTYPMPTFMVVVNLSNYMLLLLQFQEQNSAQKLTLPHK